MKGFERMRWQISHVLEHSRAVAGDYLCVIDGG